jgi:FKBP-type peptidyl-prolyl cis-trans isomerase
MYIKHIPLLFAVLLSGATLNAQSGKDLQAEVNRLKSEVARLTDENTALQKQPEFNMNDEDTKASYGLGMWMAFNIKNQGADSLDVEALKTGFTDAFTDQPLKIDQQEAMSAVQAYMQKAYGHKVERERAENTKFLSENKKKPGVKETASGLQYEVIAEGKGKSPGPNDKVTVHYTGKLLDGTVFDSSVERGQPSTFGVTQVIPGWTEALQLMKEGDKWRLYIPDQLGYGERGAGGQIPPFALLVFEVELIKVN